MSKLEGQNKALVLTKGKLKNIDIQARLKLLGFNCPSDEEMPFKLFNKEVVLHLQSLELSSFDSNTTIKMEESILFFHSLLCEVPFKETNELITFRELSGGQFYWNPFQSRTVKPLVKRFSNDLLSLKKSLDRFEWKPQDYGDFSAEINPFGKIYIVLVYHIGDDEFPPAADILFPKTIKQVYNAEDVAVLASRICIGLL